MRRSVQTFVYAVLLLIIPPLGLLPIFPAFSVFDKMDGWLGILDRSLYMLVVPLLAWPTAFALVLLTVGLIVIVRWIVLPNVKEGVYSIHSWFYVRKWAVSLATEVTLETLVVAVCDRLYAHMVSHDGREDRQGFRNLDQYRGSL